MGRITVLRGDRYLIPKDKIKEASEKLSRYEDIEELEDIKVYSSQLHEIASQLRIDGRPETAKAVEQAAAKIVDLNNFVDTAAGRILRINEQNKKEILDFIDDVDGLLYDDPVYVIRKKIEEVL